MINRFIPVSWVFVLALGLASAYVIDDEHPDAGTMTEDMNTAKIEEEMVDEMFNLDKLHDRNFLKEPVVDEDIPASIKAKAKSLVANCRRKVKPRYRKLEQRGALRKDYQAIQHGKKNFISDANWLGAKTSEVCSACVLNKLCKRVDVFRKLGIDMSRLAKKKERECKLRIIRMALDLKPKHVPNKKCNPNARFRTIDGTCNNLQNPSFGAVDTPFERAIPPDYGDCISTLRLSASGEELPNARNVSRFVHGSNADRTNPNSNILTHLAMNFGQFVDHDMTLAKAQGLNCEPHVNNPECINIEIPNDDATFRNREVDFIELERDAPYKPASGCKLVAREHVNTLTAYIDASQIYGSTKELADSLRNPNGLLKDMKHPTGCPLKNLLPPQTEGFCQSKDPNRPCFVTGDIRDDENQGLASVHTIFMRQHNRIATFFGQKTPWNAQRIYQETRKIVGAQLQVITYKEFLPLFLSWKRINDFNLKLLRGAEFFKGYNKTVNAQMIAGFSVAAYRMGHSLIQELFRRFSPDGFQRKGYGCNVKNNSEFLPIPVLDFGNPTYLYDTCQGGIDSIIRGLLTGSAAKFDGRFSSSVQENLFRGPCDLSDLVSINIKRGRDRGIPGYTKYRNIPYYRLRRVTTFDDLEKVAGFDPKDVANLKLVYDNVHDIDLFTGGTLESPASDGGILGPTFQCLIAEQFRRLRVGDRFWHENAPDKQLNTDRTAFTPCQLRELRKTTLAKIICVNADNIPAINRKVLQLSKIKVPCKKLPRVNLNAWKPGFKCNVGKRQDANNDDTDVYANNDDADVDANNDDADVDANNDDVDANNDDADVDANNDADVDANNDETDVDANNDDADVDANNGETDVDANNDDADVDADNDDADVDANNNDEDVDANNDETDVDANNDDADVDANNDDTDVYANNDDADVDANNDAYVNANNDADVDANNDDANNDDADVDGDNDETDVDANNDDADVDANNDDADVDADNDETDVDANNDDADVDANNDDADVDANNDDTDVDANNDDADVDANNDDADVDANNDDTDVDANNDDADVDDNADVDANNDDADVDANNDAYVYADDTE